VNRFWEVPAFSILNTQGSASPLRVPLPAPNISSFRMRVRCAFLDILFFLPFFLAAGAPSRSFVTPPLFFLFLLPICSCQKTPHAAPPSLISVRFEGDGVYALSSAVGVFADTPLSGRKGIPLQSFSQGNAGSCFSCLRNISCRPYL